MTPPVQRAINGADGQLSLTMASANGAAGGAVNLAGESSDTCRDGGSSTNTIIGVIIVRSSDAGATGGMNGAIALR